MFLSYIYIIIFSSFNIFEREMYFLQSIFKQVKKGTNDLFNFIHFFIELIFYISSQYATELHVFI